MLMGLSFGAVGLGTMLSSARGPMNGFEATMFPFEVLEMRVRQFLQTREVLIVVTVYFVMMLLAYLTNPNEASFRTYLTELAFRRHLTRLYDGQESADQNHERLTDDQEAIIPASRVIVKASNGKASPQVKSSKSRTARDHEDMDDEESRVSSSASGFHFANRASISLRTPNHFFRSFLFLTIAAVPVISDTSITRSAIETSGSQSLPVVQSKGKQCKSPTEDCASAQEDEVVARKWFIGLFGKWWLGGTLKLSSRAGRWYKLMLNEKTGAPLILTGSMSFRALDFDPVTEGFVRNVTTSISSFAATTRQAMGKNGRTPLPTVANKVSHGSTGHRIQTPTQRSSSPPPLPRGAALPLHSPPRTPAEGQQSQPPHRALQEGLTVGTLGSAGAPSRPRLSPSYESLRKDSTQSLRASGAMMATQHSSTPPIPFHTSPNTTLDTSAIIVDILKQLNAVEAAYNEASENLNNFETNSTAATAALQSSLDAARETKRKEDNERSELKSRIKALEDSKRHAETAKRDADRRLKSAQTRRDRALTRFDALNKDMQALWQRATDDQQKRSESESATSIQEAELQKQVDHAKREISVAEDVIAALVVRARDLESQVKDEKDALVRVLREADERKRERDAKAELDAFIVQPRQTITRASDSDPTMAPSNSPAPSAPQVTLLQRRAPLHEPEAIKTTTAEVPRPTLESPIALHSKQIAPQTIQIVHQQQHRRTGSLNDNDEPLVAPNRHSASIHNSPELVIGPIGSRSGGRVSGDTATRSGHTFSPFGDSGPLTPFVTSLLPSSLFTSLDGASPSPEDAPTSPFDQLRSPGSILPADWQRPSPIEPISRRPWENDMSSQAVVRPSSASFSASPAAENDSFGSLGPGATMHRSSSDEQEGQHIGRRRWFGSSGSFSKDSTRDVSGTSPQLTSSPSQKSSLNANAKVFNFTRGRSFMFPSTEHNSPYSASAVSSYTGSDLRGSTARGSTTSLRSTLINPSPPHSHAHAVAPSSEVAAEGSSFLNSLRAFTPSAEERAVLQRAIGGHVHHSHGGSWDQAPATDLALSSVASGEQRSAASSGVKSFHASGSAGAWGDAHHPVQASPENKADLSTGLQDATSFESANSRQRFSSLWRRKRATSKVSEQSREDVEE